LVVQSPRCMLPRKRPEGMAYILRPYNIHSRPPLTLAEGQGMATRYNIDSAIHHAESSRGYTLPCKSPVEHTRRHYHAASPVIRGNRRSGLRFSGRQARGHGPIKVHSFDRFSRLTSDGSGRRSCQDIPIEQRVDRVAQREGFTICDLSYSMIRSGRWAWSVSSLYWELGYRRTILLIVSGL
jgi:hypothetical protein